MKGHRTEWHLHYDGKPRDILVGNLDTVMSSLNGKTLRAAQVRILTPGSPEAVGSSFFLERKEEEPEGFLTRIEAAAERDAKSNLQMQ